MYYYHSILKIEYIKYNYFCVLTHILRRKIIMSDEMSVESLYAEGLGGINKRANPIASVEGFDGDFDSAAIELQSSENLMHFVDTMDSISNNVTASKVRMLSRIKRNYGAGSHALENWCDERSREANESGAAQTDAKKPNVFVRMWTAIVKFVKKVWGWIVTKAKAFGNWVRNLFTKKNVVEGMSPEDEKKLTTDMENAIFTLDKAYVVKQINFRGFMETCDGFVKLADKLVELAQAYGGSATPNPDQISKGLEIASALISKIPGVTVPRLTARTPEGIRAFKDALRKVTITYEGHEAEYAKYFFGCDYIQKGKITGKDIIGGMGAKKVLAMISDFDKNKNVSLSKLSAAQKKFDNASSIIEKNGGKVTANGKADAAKVEAGAVLASVGGVFSKVQALIAKVYDDVQKSVIKAGDLLNTAAKKGAKPAAAPAAPAAVQ
jgi:hypothetical protein